MADVAWAAGPTTPGRRPAFSDGPRRSILLETARYWASRIALEADGRAHIYGVIGPDEYHGPVDDDAFTNVMARWNLRRAAARLPGRRPDEQRRWRYSRRAGRRLRPGDAAL